MTSRCGSPRSTTCSSRWPATPRYGLAWGCACLALVADGPESAQGISLVILFPLAFISNTLVPTAHMPLMLREVADWNPLSAVTAAARHLWANPNPSASIHAWPMQHPVWAALAGRWR
jgi:ABC-2 type transport system permease protein